MRDVIEVRGLRVSAVVGVLAEERLRPQPLEIDLDLVRPFGAAAVDDDLGETTNYAEVVALVESVVRTSASLLLETLAHLVARETLALDPAVTEVTVAVRKLRPPIAQDADTVGVRTTLAR